MRTLRTKLEDINRASKTKRRPSLPRSRWKTPPVLSQFLSVRFCSNSGKEISAAPFLSHKNWRSFLPKIGIAQGTGLKKDIFIHKL